MTRIAFALVAVLSGCGSEPEIDADASAAPDADVDADVDVVPMIGEALAEDCGAYTPASGVGAGDDLHKVTLTAPEAVCNDGTPGVMFVRPSTGGANSGRWVFYLQGGHACGGFEDCAIRYCGTERYTKAKMSSTWTPMVANTDGQGLLDRDGVNPFGDANQVLLYYCSSDTWTGTNQDVVLADEDDPSLRYRLHFRGHAIVDAALDQLLAGEVTSDDGAVTMPDLDGATQVLWSGASAGGAGAAMNGDHVAARLPGATVRIVIDANLPPALDALDPDIRAIVEPQMRDQRWPVVQRDRWGAFVDATCAAAHAGDDAWLCGDQQHVVHHHITTPFFVRQDLRDTVIGAGYLTAGATLPELATAWATSLATVPAIADDAEEADAITIAPGIHAPNCSQHVGISSRDYFQVATMAPDTGPAITYRAALLAWLAGNPIDLVDTQPASRSDCPPPADTGE